MRIAILADIRANETALLAVLEHLRDLDVDQTWVIGSLLSYGPDPIVVADMVRGALPESQCLIGHLDAAIISGEMWGFGVYAKIACRWAHDLLKPGSPTSHGAQVRWTWLSRLGSAGGEEACRLYAARPLQPDAGYLPITTLYRDQLPAEFNAVSRCAFVGHLCQPGIVFVDTMEWIPITDDVTTVPVEGRRFIACPGAVGQPRDGNPKASYVIYDGSSITWYRVAYDVAETQRRILANAGIDNPGLKNFFAERLAEGR